VRKPRRPRRWCTIDAVTHAIRLGRGPFHDASVGGVHVHHQVYGIFLLLGTGTAEVTYRPAPPWVHVLAVLFGVGAALTLDEFALWLRLDDVGTLRLARPTSPWARRWYRPGSRRALRSSARFPPGRRNRWDALVDLFSTVPTRPET
jgi:hypothetical protein